MSIFSKLATVGIGLVAARVVGCGRTGLWMADPTALPIAAGLDGPLMRLAPRFLEATALLAALALGCGESKSSNHEVGGGAGTGAGGMTSGAGGGFGGFAGAATAGASGTCDPPRFADPALEQAVRMATGGDVSKEGVASITQLTATHAGIATLGGLECATGLRQELDLTGNAISELAPLSELEQLERLRLGANPLGDVRALAPLVALTELALNDSSLSDLSALSELAVLSNLNIGRTPVASFEPLANLHALRALFAPGVKATSLEPLAGLELQSLNVADAPLADLDVLGGLTTLVNLDVSGTGAASLDVLSALTALEELVATDNAVSDVAVLAPLRALRIVKLDGNRIVELDALERAPWQSGTELTLTQNPLSSHALNDVVPILCGRGYRVTTDGPSCGSPPR